MADRPRFGRHHGLDVHLRAVDHLPDGNAVQRFNKWLMVKVTTGVGTAWCAYIFAVIALASLRSTLALHSVNADVQWVAQTFLQLVLLAIILAGQNIQSVAGDARAAKTFDDGEANKAALITALDRLDCETEGGIKTLMDMLAAIDKKLGKAQ